MLVKAFYLMMRTREYLPYTSPYPFLVPKIWPAFRRYTLVPSRRERGLTEEDYGQRIKKR
jgi:hypothetical protein